MRNQPPNVRFWEHVNGGPVRLTLRPGQRLNHCQGAPTEEGHAWQAETWEYDPDAGIVTVEYDSGGRDCDGRHGRHVDYHCQVADLVSGYEPAAGTRFDEYHTRLERPHWLGVRWPKWQKGTASQYDEFAELAGY